MPKITQGAACFLPVAGEDGLEEGGDEEEDGVAEPHGDEDGDDATVEGTEAVFLDEDRSGTPGVEKHGKAGPGGVGAGFAGEEGGGTAVSDVFVVFGVVVDLLEGADLVEGVGEG